VTDRVPACRGGQYTFDLLMLIDLDKPNPKIAGNVNVVFVKRLVTPDMQRASP